MYLLVTDLMSVCANVKKPSTELLVNYLSMFSHDMIILLGGSVYLHDYDQRCISLRQTVASLCFVHTFLLTYRGFIFGYEPYPTVQLCKPPIPVYPTALSDLYEKFERVCLVKISDCG